MFQIQKSKNSKYFKSLKMLHSFKNVEIKIKNISKKTFHKNSISTGILFNLQSILQVFFLM